LIRQPKLLEDDRTLDVRAYCWIAQGDDRQTRYFAALHMSPHGTPRLREYVRSMAGDNWCIGQVGDRLDGKPTEHKEYEGAVDHAIRIVWAGMPAFPAQPGAPHIETEPVKAISSPQPDTTEPQPAVAHSDGEPST
jgi:hypothetical protein